MSKAYREYGRNMTPNISFSSVSKTVLDNECCAVLQQVLLERYTEEATKGKCKRRFTRYQTCPRLAQERRRLHGLMEELRVEDPQSFFDYLKIEPAMFDELVQRVGSRIPIFWHHFKSIIPRMRPECLEWSWNAERLFRMLQECS